MANEITRAQATHNRTAFGRCELRSTAHRQVYLTSTHWSVPRTRRCMVLRVDMLYDSCQRFNVLLRTRWSLHLVLVLAVLAALATTTVGPGRGAYVVGFKYSITNVYATKHLVEAPAMLSQPVWALRNW